MIEADVFVGRWVGDNNESIPDLVIMAHGPNTVISDLTLEDFLTKVATYNKDKNAETVKGIKLDFKSIDAFTKSSDQLNKIVRSTSKIERRNYGCLQFFSLNCLLGRQLSSLVEC